MNSISKAPMTGFAKFALVLFVVCGAIRFTDFIFYGQELHNLLSGVGFALMSFGVYTNGFAKEAINPAGRYASIAGAVMVIAAIAIRYLA